MIALPADPLRPWRAAYGASPSEKALRLVPAVLYALIIYGFSALPASDVPPLVDDRILHFVEYFGFGICLALATAGWARKNFAVPHAAAAVLAGMLYAVTDEWHQSFVPGRDPSLRDLGSDLVGLVAAQAVVLLLVRREVRA